MVLRVVIGWHFFKEGSKKIVSGDFSSTAFLRSAKGPFAENFRGLAHDLHGHQRFDGDYIKERGKKYHDLAVSRYNLNADGKKVAETLLDSYYGRIDYYLGENEEEIQEYFLEVDRYEQDRQNSSKRGIPYYEDRLAKKDSELYGKLNKWTRPLARFEVDFVDDLNRIGQELSTANKPLVRTTNPAQGRTDMIVTWVVFLTGVLLIVGLGTRLAALAGAGFLLQVMASQWPGSYGADAVYYQSVEFVALLLLAAVGAGRFAGLDFIVWNLCSKCCQGRTPVQGDET